jgi:hypothetical protein
MVRIWGRWCGPTWTAGQAIPAKDYDWATDPSPRAQDDLDMACRIHDRVLGTTDDKRARAISDELLGDTAAAIARREPLSSKGIAARGISVAMKAKAVWD